jgi:regulator of sigma D
LQYKKHVLREDSLFYAKLFKKYKGYDTIIHGIKEVREELNDLTMKFERFVALYSSVEAIKNKLRAFVNDIEHLGEALKERMEFEEKRLYILY